MWMLTSCTVMSQASQQQVFFTLSIRLPLLGSLRGRAQLKQPPMVQNLLQQGKLLSRSKISGTLSCIWVSHWMDHLGSLVTIDLFSPPAPFPTPCCLRGTMHWPTIKSDQLLQQGWSISYISVEGTMLLMFSPSTFHILHSGP